MSGLGFEEGVKHTVLDALALDYKVVVIQDATGGWEEKGIKKARREMEKAGAIFVTMDSLMSLPDQ